MELTASDECNEVQNVVLFLRIYIFGMSQKNKKNDKADMADDLKKCQSIFRESCIKTGVGTNYNKKLGCATPEEWKSID